MIRKLCISLAVAAALSSAASAQGPLQRVGQALDNAGRNVRHGIEGSVARGQVVSYERDLLSHVTQRLNLDKRLVGSALQVIVEPTGAVILRGSARDEGAKTLAAELVANTLGVTTVVDEIAVVKDLKVLESAPVVIEPVAVVEPAPVIVPAAPVIVTPARETKPVQSKVIVKP